MESHWTEHWPHEEAIEEGLTLLDTLRIGIVLIVLLLAVGTYRGCVEDGEPAPAIGKAVP